MTEAKHRIKLSITRPIEECKSPRIIDLMTIAKQAEEETAGLEGRDIPLASEADIQIQLESFEI